MFMNKCVLINIAILAFLTSCHTDTDLNTKIDHALEIAGDNRAQLQLVIDHYSNDSLRLKAAKYLIGNMPGHYSYPDTFLLTQYYQRVDSFISSNPDISFSEMSDSVNTIYRNMGIDRCHPVEDCCIITAHFIIDNIDSAFLEWKRNPLLEHLTFDQFCEYILPYKSIELQPLDNWRNKFKNSYKEDLEELQYCDIYSRSAFQTAKKLNDAFIRDIHPEIHIAEQFPVYDISTRLKVRYGRCDDFVNMTTNIFRSVGLPVVRDHTPHWGCQRLGHSWNALLAQNGKTVPFTGMNSRVGEDPIINDRLAKVFRSTYASNSSIIKLNNSGEFVPVFFRNRFQHDVTDEYVSSVKAPVICPRGITNHYAFLCVFGDNDWTPVDFASINNGTVIFNNIGPGIVYLPVVYNQQGQAYPLSLPFIVYHDNSIITIEPQHNNLTSAKLFRKYLVKPYTFDYAKLVKDGIFEGSNNADFSGKLYTVGPILTGHAIGGEFHVSDTIPSCQYWRYINRNDQTFGSMADLFFYQQDCEIPVSGRIIGTEGSWENNPEYIRENLFDGNALTAYCAPKHRGCWVGLDMGKPTKISKIRYTPRGDGNMVEPGDEYELYYWEYNHWQSLGRKTATTVSIDFDNIPTGALLLLRDHTKGHEERIFTLTEEGQQIFH